MKLQKLIRSAFVAGIISCASFSGFAQGAYVKLGGGYNFGLNAGSVYSTKDTDTGDFANPGSTQTFEKVSLNLGQGGVFGGALGYMFNNNIGFEVGVNYLAGAETSYGRERNFSNTGPTVAPYSERRTHTYQSKLVFVQPSLVISAGLPKLNPYMHMGLAIANGNLKTGYSFSNSNGDTEEMEMKDSGGTHLGLQAAIGVNLKLNDKVALFAEGTFSNINFAPEKGELTKHTSNGTDLLPYKNTSQKEVKYVDNPTFSYPEQQSPSEPGTDFKLSYPVSSIGLQVGVQYNF